MEINSPRRPISIILSQDVPLILSEQDWADTIIARSRDGHGMQFRIPRKPVPRWTAVDITPQPGVYPIRDSFHASAEEFPKRPFPKLEPLKATCSSETAPEPRAIEVEPKSYLRRFLDRISRFLELESI